MFEMLTGKYPLKVKNSIFGAWYKAHKHHQPLYFRSVNDNLNLQKSLEDLVIRLTFVTLNNS